MSRTRTVATALLTLLVGNALATLLFFAGITDHTWDGLRVAVIPGLIFGIPGSLVAAVVIIGMRPDEKTPPPE